MAFVKRGGRVIRMLIAVADICREGCQRGGKYYNGMRPLPKNRRGRVLSVPIVVAGTYSEGFRREKKNCNRVCVAFAKSKTKQNKQQQQKKKKRGGGDVSSVC